MLFLKTKKDIFGQTSYGIHIHAMWDHIIEIYIITLCRHVTCSHMINVYCFVLLRIFFFFFLSENGSFSEKQELENKCYLLQQQIYDMEVCTFFHFHVINSHWNRITFQIEKPYHRNLVYTKRQSGAWGGVFFFFLFIFFFWSILEWLPYKKCLKKYYTMSHHSFWEWKAISGLRVLASLGVYSSEILLQKKWYLRIHTDWEAAF